MPVALFGIVWFGLVALIAWFSTPARDGKSPQPGGTYLFAISTIGLAVVLYLGYTSWSILKTFCVLCLGTYVAVAGIFITSGVSSPMSVSQLFGRFASDLGAAFKQPLVLVLTLALLGGTGYAAAVFPREVFGPAGRGARPGLAGDFSRAGEGLCRRVGAAAARGHRRSGRRREGRWS